jgi:hypothetical protein
MTWTIYDTDELQTLADLINKGKFTLGAAAASVHDIFGNPRKITDRGLAKAFKHFHIVVNPKRGRPQVEMPPAAELFVLTQQAFFPMGVTRMAAWLDRPEHEAGFGCRITPTMVYKVYDRLDLYRYERPHAAELIKRCRYEACKVHVFWHTDLHLYRGGIMQPDEDRGLVIAFIDDASRVVVGHECIPDKRAVTVRGVLERILLATGVTPYAIWSDNGGEFKGEFQGLLQEQGIRHVYTKPRNPQQNGKIERWWRTLEGSYSAEGLGEWVEAYNKRPHMGLGFMDVPNPRGKKKPTRRVRMTPLDAFENLPHWHPGEVPQWKVDGVVRDFVLPGDHTTDPAAIETDI